MKKYLLPEQGQFYKVNLHCHTTFSDGKRTPEEVKNLYKKLGYSAVAFTDHDILIPHDELTDESFVALHGFEAEINDVRAEGQVSEPKTCHMCFVGIDPENITQPMWHRTKYLFGHAPEHRDEVVFDENEPDFERAYNPDRLNEMMRIGKEKGFFVTYNHPTWSQESYPQYNAYNEMNAFEIFNGSCLSMGYDDDNFRVYNDMLYAGKHLYAIGADDNHNGKPDFTRDSDSGVAWTMVKAEKLDYSSLTGALVNGSFYASTGPEIHEIAYEDGKVYVKTSDADRIAYNCGRRHGTIRYAEEGSSINEAVFDVKPDSKYFIITVTDAKGYKAYSNAYFFDEIENG